MEEYETVTLILNSNDISASQNPQTFYNAGTANVIDNQYGTISNNKCNITWKNINLRMLMGNDIYDKYETFNLYLYQITQGQGLSPGNTSSGSNGCVDIKIKGLSFLNNTYNTTTNLNTDESFLTSYILYLVNKDTGTGAVTPMFNPSILTFSKGSDIVDININMKKHMIENFPQL